LVSASRQEKEGTLSMWVFLSARLRTWLLLAIALPLARLLVQAGDSGDSNDRRQAFLRWPHQRSQKSRRRDTWKV
jgi:hypothetical protein